MKAERKEMKEFKPVVLTLETQDEVNKLFALMNHTDLIKATNLIDNPLAGLQTNEYDEYHENLMNIKNMGSGII